MLRQKNSISIDCVMMWQMWPLLSLTGHLLHTSHT
jgi:hypothetical protein